MTKSPEKSAAIPCLRYRDAPAMIRWLCEVVGFKENAVYPNGDGTVAHAQLTLGGGMIMLGSVAKETNSYGELVKQPDDVGGFETQTVYLVVDDADTVYTRVKQAGANVVIDIKDEDYGGRGFTFRDPEGHVWTVGTYDPWAG